MRVRQAERRRSGGTRISESMKRMRGPEAAAAPALRVAETPGAWGSWMGRKPREVAAEWTEGSGPSMAMMTSRGGGWRAVRESRQASRIGPLRWAGTTMLTLAGWCILGAVMVGGHDAKG